MTVELYAAVDAGRARSNNEDSVASDAAVGLAVLADGMGGYNAGEVASNMATSFIHAELGRWLREAGAQASDAEVRRAMNICVDNANRAIYNASTSQPQYAGMGTTLVVAVFRKNRLLLGHVGDSRCYRLRAGRLQRLTRDHSLLQEQIDAGLITPEQAAFSANKNLVTRAVGVEDTVELESHQHEVQAEDTYLLCSDGLSDMLDEAEIARLLSVRAPAMPQMPQMPMTPNAPITPITAADPPDEAADTSVSAAATAAATATAYAAANKDAESARALETTARELIAAANDAGGRDNISVVVISVCGGASPAVKSWWPFRR